MFLQGDGVKGQGKTRGSMGSTGSEVDSSLSPSSGSSIACTLEKDVSLFLQRISDKHDVDSNIPDSSRDNSRKRHDTSVRTSTGSRSTRSTSTDSEEYCKYCDSYQNERQYFLWRSQYVKTSYCSRCSGDFKETPYISYWGKPSYKTGSWRKRYKEGRSVDIDLTPLIDVLHRIDRIDTSMGKPRNYHRAYGSDTSVERDGENNTSAYESNLTRIADDSRSKTKMYKSSTPERIRQYSHQYSQDTDQEIEKSKHADNVFQYNEHLPRDTYETRTENPSSNFSNKANSFRKTNDEVFETSCDNGIDTSGHCNILNVKHENTEAISKPSRETAVVTKAGINPSSPQICNKILECEKETDDVKFNIDNIDGSEDKSPANYNDSRVHQKQGNTSLSPKIAYNNYNENNKSEKDRSVSFQIDHIKCIDDKTSIFPNDHIKTERKYGETEEFKSVKDIISNIEAMKEKQTIQEVETMNVDTPCQYLEKSLVKTDTKIEREHCTHVAAISKLSQNKNTRISKVDINQESGTSEEGNKYIRQGQNYHGHVLISRKTTQTPVLLAETNDGKENKEHFDKTGFVLKPNGTDYCKANSSPINIKTSLTSKYDQKIIQNKPNVTSDHRSTPTESTPMKMTENQRNEVSIKAPFRADEPEIESELKHIADRFNLAQHSQKEEVVVLNKSCFPKMQNDLATTRKPRTGSDKSQKSNASSRNSPVPRYQQKRRLSRSQRDRRSSLTRTTLTLEDEDDEFMKIQQKLNSLGRYSTWRSASKPTENSDTITIPKTLWNRSIRNAIYGPPAYNSTEESITDKDGQVSELSKAISDESAGTADDSCKQKDLTCNVKARSDVNDSVKNTHLTKIVESDYDEDALKENNSANAEEKDTRLYSCYENRKQTTDRFMNDPHRESSNQHAVMEIKIKEQNDRTLKLESADQRISKRNAIKSTIPNLDSGETEWWQQLRQNRKNSKDQESVDTDNDGSGLELDTDDEETNKLNWRSRGYSYDFYMSRKSRTGTEIIQQYKQSRSNRSSKGNSPSSSSAASSRKSSLTGRPRSMRSFRHLGSLEENTNINDIIATSGRKSNTLSTPSQCEKDEKGIDAGLLKVALERAANCTQRLNDRLKTQLS